jgi:hypothetical protein
LGLIVTQHKEVYFDPDRELLVNTSIESNPQSQRYNGVLVYSIFRRLHAQSNGQNNPGDGNPLIFALKEMKGYSISDEEWRKFSLNKSIIIKQIIDKYSEFNNILCIPSSNSVVYATALSISECSSFKGPVSIQKHCFEKKTISEIYDSFLQVEVPKKLKKLANKFLADMSKLKDDSSSVFEMKAVDYKIRPYISTLKLVDGFYVNPNQSYIFVEDLISSGSTITSAIECLIANGVPKENILGISLLSKI